MEGVIAMTRDERDRLRVIEAVLEGRLGQQAAAERLELSVRQIKRLCRRVREHGAAGLHDPQGRCIALLRLFALDTGNWLAVMPMDMLMCMWDCCCESAPAKADSMPTVATSRLCQSRLSRSKMSPNR